MSFKFKFYGTVDIEPIRQKMAASPLVDWDEYTYRQKTFDAHKETKTVPILFDESFSSVKVTERKCADLFRDDLAKLKLQVDQVCGREGYFIRAILVMLPARTRIAEHVDSGGSLMICKRIHIPVTTNEKCLFTVGGEVRNLKVGEMWEINNAGERHSVANDGDTDRVHLLVDWMPKPRTPAK